MGSYEENNEMEQLGQEILRTTLELEKLRAEAMEEMMKNKQYAKQLIHLLKYAIHERDEARSQFQKLLNQTVPLATPPDIPLFQSDGPLFKPAVNSSVTESNSHSDAYSPVNSLFDVVSSPDMANQPFIQQSVPPFVVAPHIDGQSSIIDSIASGRVLPEKGNLLKAVVQSGPLLQTLLVAGLLPRWRNPPQGLAFQIPPVSIKGDRSAVFSYTAASGVGQLSGRSVNVQPYAQMSCGSARIQTVPMLSFANSGLGNYMTNTSGYGLKRQRFC